ncbi:MAG: hypothetical protein AAB632_02120 [Patescibacteria group bacterium]
MNLPGELPSEGVQLTEEERFAKRTSLKEEIKELSKGNQGTEDQMKALELKGQLFDISNEDESIRDLKEAVGFYKALHEPNEEDKTEIGALMRNAWGDRKIDLETYKQMPNLTAGVEEVMENNKWIAKNSEGPVGGNEILE